MEIKNADLRGFVESVKDIDGVNGIILYGSTSDVMNNYDNASDIDLFVCLESDTFRTELKPYEEVAKLTHGKIKPAIKSVREFSSDNCVSFTRRSIQHLKNAGVVLYEAPGLSFENEIKDMWNYTAQDSYKIEDSYKTAPSFIIRHRFFELCRGVMTKVMDDKQTCFDSPSKSFWQNVSDMFLLYLKPEEEKHIIPLVAERYIDNNQIGPWTERIDITAAEYQDYVYQTIREDITRLNKKLRTSGLSEEVIASAKESYFEYKNLIEDNMWMLNEFLLEGYGSS